MITSFLTATNEDDKAKFRRSSISYSGRENEAEIMKQFVLKSNVKVKKEPNLEGINIKLR